MAILSVFPAELRLMTDSCVTYVLEYLSFHHAMPAQALRDYGHGFPRSPSQCSITASATVVTKNPIATIRHRTANRSFPYQHWWV